MDKMKEFMQDDKKMYTAAIVVLAICIACWYMFSGGIPDNGGSINEVRNELSAARAELDRANKQLSDSQAIVEELRRTNIDLSQQIIESRTVVDKIRQANSDIASQIERSSTINQSNLELVRECQQTLRPVRETGQVREK